MKILIPSTVLITMSLLLGACAVLPAPDSLLEESTPTIADLSTNPGPTAAIKLLASQQKIVSEQIEVVSTVPYDWADTCLGLPQPGETCATSVVSGYRVELKIGDATYIFRTDVAGDIIRQEKEDGDGIIYPPSPAVWGEMSRQLGVDPKDVNVIRSEVVNWPDACLGILGPGETCAQVITPGFRYVVVVNGQTVEFRIDQNGTTVRMVDASGSELGETSQPTGTETAFAPLDQTIITGIVTTNGEDLVNVRSGPGAVFEQIATLSNGQTVTITGRSPQWEWWRIQSDGLEGWVYSAFLVVDSAAGIPCVEQKAGDCAISGLPAEHDQAIASIRAFRNQDDLALTFGGETPNPNADMRDSLVYRDNEGGEYLVDKEKLQVVFWMPQAPADSGSTKTVEELRALALTFAYHQSQRLALDASSLTFTQMTKDGSNYAFRWEDQSITGHTMTPFLQVVIRSDGEIVQFMHTLDIWAE